MAIEIPHFHDGSFDGITLGEKSAKVFLRKSNGEQYMLTLSGLEALQMEDFRQGNTISMIEVICQQKPYEHCGLERLFQPPHPSAAKEYHSAHDEVLRKQSARIVAGEISLVAIVPSYGADLLAICREVSLTPHSKNDS